MNLTNILKNKKNLANLTFGIAFSLTEYCFAQNRSINFEKKSFENIKKEAKSANKLIFIDGYTTWCSPCKWMDKNVFTNDSVADFYNKNFLNIKIDMELEEGKRIEELFAVKSYPTFLYTNAEGKLIHQGVGRHKSGEFITLGKEALNPETQIAGFNKKYEEGNRNNKFLYEYIKKLNKAKIDHKDISREYFKTQKEEDLTSIINWNILFINEHNVDIDSKPFNYLIKNKIKFDEIYTADSVDNKILNAYSFNFDKILYKKSFNDSIYQVWRNKIKKQNFSKVEEVLLEADLKYNEQMKNWDAYAENAVLLVEISKRYNNPNKLNDLAWGFFENVKDKNYLEKALSWAEKSVKRVDKFDNNDNYARLLYVLGDTAKAIQIEEKAIRLAKETSNERFIEQLNYILQKMKNGERLD